MAQDPLSIPTTVLPESTFDPVQFAKERRQEILTAQKERREQFNKAWESVGTPSGVNRNVYAEIMKKRTDWMDKWAEKSAQGINVFDISHPKYGKEAIQASEELRNIDAEVDQSIVLDKYLATLRDVIAKDDKGVINVDATNKNIATLKGLNNMDEVNKFMASKGDNLLEINEPQFNLDEEIFNYLKKTGVKGIPESYSDKEGGFLVTREYETISPEQLRSSFSGMLSDPKIKAKVKKMREEDVTDLRGGSDLEYLMERKGNKMVRQQVGFASKPYEPPKSTEEKPEKPKYQATSEPVKTTFSFGKSGKYESTGDNTVVFDQSKVFNISPGSGTLDIENSKPANIKGSIEFKPVNTTEYTVSTKDYKNWKAGTILPDTEKGKPNTKKVRFVEGIYTVKDTKVDEETGREITVEVPKTILIPYENIKNELDVTYKVAKDIPQTKTSNLEELRSKYRY